MPKLFGLLEVHFDKMLVAMNAGNFLHVEETHPTSASLVFHIIEESRISHHLHLIELTDR